MMNLLAAIERYENILKLMWEDGRVRDTALARRERQDARDALSSALFRCAMEAENVVDSDYLPGIKATEGYALNGVIYVPSWDSAGKPDVIRLDRIRHAVDVAELQYLYPSVPDHPPGYVPLSSEVVGKPVII